MNKTKLWAPWRVGYISKARRSSSSACIFCRIGRGKLDSENHVVTRKNSGFSLLNRYPYNNGHLMVAPYKHVGRLSLLTKQEWAELLDLTNDAIHRLDKVFSPHGYNVGINLGRSAGAGIPGHLHLHIVPRWVGDTNFMSTVAGTKVISQSLEAAHHLLKKAGNRGGMDAKKKSRRASHKKSA